MLTRSIGSHKQAHYMTQARVQMQRGGLCYLQYASKRRDACQGRTAILRLHRACARRDTHTHISCIVCNHAVYNTYSTIRLYAVIRQTHMEYAT